jgi:formylmethanofuran dehydrogenase subunit D
MSTQLGSLIKDFQFVLTAGQRISINRKGNVVRCIQSQASFTISPNDTEKVAMQAGVGITFNQDFDYVVLENGSSGQTVTIYIGSGEIADSRFYGSVNSTVVPGSTLDCPVHVARTTGGTSTIAANLLRRAITIGSLSTNTGVIFAGESGSVDATHGVEIQPGTNFRFENTAAIDVFNGSGATQTFWILEEA